jgi:hypothetical protein
MMRAVVAEMRRRARGLTTGFTLVELMVAVTGGLFVSIAVFMLAKQATGLYQSEARISNATLGSMVGFERLRMDIERAAYLASPNIRRDPKVCGLPDATWPTYLSTMTSVFIQPSTTAPAVLTSNHITPDEITLAGSFASVEQFWTQSIDGSGGTNHVVALQTASPPMARLGYQNMTTAADQRTLLLSVFGIGRALRIVDTEGHEQYGTILDVQGGSTPAVLLKPSSPAILYRGVNTTLKCGVMGNGKDHVVNVVNFVRYSLKDMSADPNYAPLFQSSVGPGAPATDTGRTELVREEIDTSGNTILGTSEVVSEFAVDLRFGLAIAETTTPTGGTTPVEQVRAIPPGDPSITSWAGTTAQTGTTRGPQRIRAIRVRFSVRSREADRVSGLSVGGDGGGGLPIASGLYRIGVGPGGGSPFARVRTMQADVALRNQRGVAWL